MDEDNSKTGNDSQNVSQTCNISPLQKAEIKRFVKLGVYTGDADAVRRLLEEGTLSVHKKLGMSPIKVNELRV